MKMSIDLVKNRGRGRCFACFTPVVVEDDDDRSSSFPSPSISEDDSVRTRRRKAAVRQLLSRSLKTIFFTTFVKKLMKSKRLKRDHGRPSIASTKFIDSNRSSTSRTFSTDQEVPLIGDTNDNSSLFSSSSSTRPSSICSTSRTASERITEEDLGQTMSMKNRVQQAVITVSTTCGSYSRRPATMCIFLACLAALVFWGKAFAIVACTSSCLYLGSSRCRRTSDQRE